MGRSRKAGLALLGLTLIAAGCRKEPPPVVAAPPQNPPPAAQPAANPAPTADPNAARAAEEARVRGILEQMVFFDFDDASIRADSRAVLDAKVPLLRQHTGFTITIEGHADERGSTEYNVALGTRRAVSVMDYLVGHGLEPQRFRTFSYGEERPLVQGSDESAWSRNRRAEFRVAGGITQER